VGDRGRALAPHATKGRADGVIRRFGVWTGSPRPLCACAVGEARVLVREASPDLALPTAELGAGARSRREDKGEGEAPSPLALP
jgi:hypothetical protein